MKFGRVHLLWVPLLLGGCHPSGKQVVGTYLTPYSRGADYVVLGADHSYVHCRKPNGIAASQAGTWHFQQQAGQEKLILRDWFFYTGPFADMDPGRLGVKTSCSVYWSKDKLLFNPDFDEYNYYRL